MLSYVKISKPWTFLGSGSQDFSLHRKFIPHPFLQKGNSTNLHKASRATSSFQPFQPSSVLSSWCLWATWVVVIWNTVLTSWKNVYLVAAAKWPITYLSFKTKIGAWAWCIWGLLSGFFLFYCCSVHGEPTARMCLYKYTCYSKQPQAIWCTQGPCVDSALLLGGFVPPCKFKDVNQGGTNPFFLYISWPEASHAKCINRNWQCYTTTLKKNREIKNIWRK